MKYINKHRWLSKHTVLIRTICFTILLVCIPCMLFTYSVVYNAEKNLEQSAQDNSSFIASTISNEFEDCAIQMMQIVRELSTDRRLFGYVLGSDVLSELSALQSLKQYLKGVSFADSVSLYSPDYPDCIYSSLGKYDLSTFETEELKLEPDTLHASLESLGYSIAFLPVHVDGGAINAVCLLPLNLFTMGDKRVCIFTITQTTLQDYIQPVLAGKHHFLAALFDSNRQMLFRSRDCAIADSVLDDYISGNLKNGSEVSQYRVFSGTSNNYSCVIYTSSSAYMESIQTYAASIKMIMCVNIAISITLSIILVWVSYHPVSKMVNALGIDGSDTPATDEYGAVVNTYLDQGRRLSELKREYNSHMDSYRERLLRNLLNGMSVSDRELAILAPEHGLQYFICAAHLSESAYSAVISNLPKNIELLVLEQDCYLVFFCKAENALSRYQTVQDLSKRLGDVALGIGALYPSVTALHQSYLESILALETSNCTGCNYIENVEDNNNAKQLDLNLQIMQLTRLIKNGDPTATEFANGLFEIIRYQTTSFLYQTYSCYQLITSCQKTMEKMGLPFSVDQAAALLRYTSVSTIRDEFNVILKDCLALIRQQNESQQRNISERMRICVNERYTDSEFTLSTFSEIFEMSESVASKTFKDIFGNSFTHYITALRIERAKELLRSSEIPIADISKAVGFGSASYFTRVFKSEEGITPVAYRDNNHLQNTASDA